MHIHKDWPSALLAINELTRTHAPLFDHDSLWKRVREATKAEDDHQRHLAVEVILKECLKSVSEYNEREQNKRDGYDLQLECFVDRFKHLYPLTNDELSGVRYCSLYRITRECYSPAEGGCWFDRHTLVATFPVAQFWLDIPDALSPRERLTNAVIAYGRDLNLVFDVVRLETFPAQYQTLRTPRYE